MPGDDVRSIDWNVTAREGRPFVKKFREERELTLVLAVDVSGSFEYGSGEVSKRELAAEIASALALSAVQSGDKVGLLLFTDRVESFVPPKKGKTHVLRVVREILGASPEGRGTDVAAALRFTERALRRRAVVVLVSDFRGERSPGAMGEALRAVGRKHDLVSVVLDDPRENELPDVGLLVLEDAETGEVVELDTGSRRVRERFARDAADSRERLTKELRRAGVDRLAVRTDEPWAPSLVRFFGERGRAA